MNSNSMCVNHQTKILSSHTGRFQLLEYIVLLNLPINACYIFADDNLLLCSFLLYLIMLSKKLILAKRSFGFKENSK